MWTDKIFENSIPLVTHDDKTILPIKTGSIQSLPKFIKNITEWSTNKLLCGLSRTLLEIFVLSRTIWNLVIIFFYSFLWSLIQWISSMFEIALTFIGRCYKSAVILVIHTTTPPKTRKPYTGSYQAYFVEFFCQNS